MIPLSHQKLIDSIVRVTSADERIQSAWLYGSHAEGDGDEWSDVDVLLICGEDKDVLPAAAHHRDNIGAIAKPVHLTNVTPAIVHTITEDWRRFDLAFAPTSFLAQRDPARVKQLFARPGAALPQGSAPPAPPAEALEPLVREFIRVLGLAGPVINRREYLVALDGCDLLRGMIVELFMLENGRRRGDRGVKRINQFLKPEQREALEALPPLGATRESLIEYNLALARIFLPRAHILADAREIAWPEAFLTATRAYLHRELNITI